MSNTGISLRKRFYRAVNVAPGSDDPACFRILLDGRAVRTPAKRELAVTSAVLAEAIAGEWRRQKDLIDPGSMPLTRIVNSALDGVAGRERQVREAILEYGGSDLLCYLADEPGELIERQAEAWGPVHAWVKQAFGVELALTSGIMPVVQDDAMLARLDAAIGPRDPVSLAALHVVTTVTGSLLLALAVTHRRVSASEAWALAHIDEDFQIERWGPDSEASVRRAHRWSDVAAACLVLEHLGS